MACVDYGDCAATEGPLAAVSGFRYSNFLGVFRGKKLLADFTTEGAKVY